MVLSRGLKKCGLRFLLEVWLCIINFSEKAKQKRKIVALTSFGLSTFRHLELGLINELD